jgi:hypothetical protein
MKILIGTGINGLKLTRELIEKLYEKVPKYFVDDGPVSAYDLGWSAAKIAEMCNSIVIGENYWRVDLWYTNDYGRDFRTDPIVHDLFDECMPNGDYKIIDIPDGIEWYIFTSDYGSESIHEKHKIWN